MNNLARALMLPYVQSAASEWAYCRHFAMPKPGTVFLYRQFADSEPEKFYVFHSDCDTVTAYQIKYKPYTSTVGQWGRVHISVADWVLNYIPTMTGEMVDMESDLALLRYQLATQEKANQKKQERLKISRHV